MVFEEDGSASVTPLPQGEGGVRALAREGEGVRSRINGEIEYPQREGFLVRLVRIYQSCISPFLPARCRFHPTCSTYAAETIQRHGMIKGGWLALCRLSRCHPWSGHGGIDPVP